MFHCLFLFTSSSTYESITVNPALPAYTQVTIQTDSMTTPSTGQNTAASDMVYKVKLDELKTGIINTTEQDGSVTSKTIFTITSATDFCSALNIPTIAHMTTLKNQIYNYYYANATTLRSQNLFRTINGLNFTYNSNSSWYSPVNATSTAINQSVTYTFGRFPDKSLFYEIKQLDPSTNINFTNLSFFPTVYCRELGQTTLIKNQGYGYNNVTYTIPIEILSYLQGLPATKQANLNTILKYNRFPGPGINSLSALDINNTGTNDPYSIQFWSYVYMRYYITPCNANVKNNFTTTYDSMPQTYCLGYQYRLGSGAYVYYRNTIYDSAGFLTIGNLFYRILSTSQFSPEAIYNNILGSQTASPALASKPPGFIQFNGTTGELYRRNKVLVPFIHYGQYSPVSTKVTPTPQPRNIGFINYDMAYNAWTGVPYALIVYDFDQNWIAIQISLGFHAGKRTDILPITNTSGTVTNTPWWPDPTVGDTSYSSSSDTQQALYITYYLDLTANTVNFTMSSKGIALSNNFVDATIAENIPQFIEALIPSNNGGQNLATTFSAITNTGLHQFTGFFLPLVNILENYEFSSKFDQKNTKTYLNNINQTFYPINLNNPAGNIRTKPTSPIPSTLLSGINTRTALLSSLGIFDWAPTISYINTILLPPNTKFLTSTFYSGEVAYYTDKFSSMAYKSGDITKVVVAGNINKLLYNTLSGHMSNPYSNLSVTNNNLYGLTQQIIVDNSQKTYTIQTIYDAFNVLANMDIPNCGITVTYEENGIITYIVTSAEIAPSSQSAQYCKSEYKIVIYPAGYTDSNNTTYQYGKYTIERVFNNQKMLLVNRPLIG